MKKKKTFLKYILPLGLFRFLCLDGRLRQPLADSWTVGTISPGELHKMSKTLVGKAEINNLAFTSNQVL